MAEVIPTRVQLSFSQLQNFIADVAIERGYDYYFWGHADVALMASNATSSFTDEILGWAARCILRRCSAHHQDRGAGKSSRSRFNQFW